MVLRGRAGSVSNKNKDAEENSNGNSNAIQSSNSGSFNKVKNLNDLENYYKSIKKNIIENQFEFQIKKKEKSRTLLVNLREKSIHIFKLKRGTVKKKQKKYLFSDIEKITKDKKDNREIILCRRFGKKDFKLLFSNTERREYFYELIWLSWLNKQFPTPSIVVNENVSSSASTTTTTTTTTTTSTMVIDEQKPQYEKISLFISTWNMGDAPPPSINSDEFKSWIPKDKQYDLYIIGVQECEYSPRKHNHHHKRGHSRSHSNNENSSDETNNINSGNNNSNNEQNETTCQEDWFSTLSEYLGHGYYKVEGTSLVKMRIVIFSKKEHYYKLNYIQKTSIATGIGNVYGNKGATLIALDFFETSFCFISSHFAAHQEKIEARNNNYKDIIKGVEMGNKELDILNQYNYVFWMGDFNYRIDGLFREEVLSHIRHNNIKKLLKYDQLSNQKATDKVFIGFKEEEIKFLPTYKTVRGIHGNVDGKLQYTNEKLRIPSWCDRILYKSLPYSHQISCLEYNSASKVTTSDHVPVYGIYESYVRLPCIPFSTVQQTSANKKTCQIIFHDLRAEGLDLVDNEERQPDAYIVFNKNSFIADDIKTPHAYKNRSPCWGDLPPIHPMISKQSYLETQHLFLTFYHDDKSIGHAAVPLGIGFQSIPFSFKTRITRNGLPAGHLFGSIQIVYIDNEIKSSSKVSPNLLGKSSPSIVTNHNHNNNNSSGNSNVSGSASSTNSPPLPPRTWLINNNSSSSNGNGSSTSEPNSNNSTPILSPIRNHNNNIVQQTQITTTPTIQQQPPLHHRAYLERGLSTASIELDDLSMDDHISVLNSSPSNNNNNDNNYLHPPLERKSSQLRKSI